MKKMFAALMIAIIALTLSVTSVEAKRLGGGGSFGKQSSGVNFYGQHSLQRNQHIAAPAKSNNSWKGIVGGALLGLGLGALLSHFGLSSAIASIISTVLVFVLLTFIAMYIYYLFRRNSNVLPPVYASENIKPKTTSSHSNYFMSESAQFYNQPQNTTTTTTNSTILTPVLPSYSNNIPVNFDVVSFIRNAKTYFIRLQAAWDKADINDILEFTTPEMFSELKLQLQERGTKLNYTDVVSLDADVLEVKSIDNSYLVSVKFSGFIKEDQDSLPTKFSEIWNLSKPATGKSGWVLAGIQQLS